MRSSDRRTARFLAAALSLSWLAGMLACSDAAPSAAEDAASSDAEYRRRRDSCGNGRCGSSESCSTCPADCGDCPGEPGAGMDASSGGDASISDAQPSSIDAGPPSAHALYVATTGSDSNPGTQAAPLRTIHKASQIALPDTTVHVAPGTYLQNVQTSADGTATGRVRYVSEVRWGAKIIGSGAESAWSNSGDHVDIVGFDISGSGRLGVVNYGSFVVVAGNHVHDLKVSGGCTGNGGAGIVNADYAKSDNDVVGNVVHDIGVPGACNGVQGIYMSNVRGRVTNNVVYRASAWGIHLWHAADRVKIVNNTVVANGTSSMGGGIVIGAGDSPGGVVVTNTIVANNIVAHNPGGSIVEYCYPGESCIGSSNQVVSNLVFGNGRAISLLVGSHSGTITADPQFVSYLGGGSRDYHLRSTSPAIEKGASLSAPSADLDGSPRPYGLAFDIGAYEWHP